MTPPPPAPPAPAAAPARAPLAWPSNDDDGKQTLLVEEYEDHGEWARHYSAVRMTLGTFFLAAAAGAIFERFDHPDARTAILAAAIALLGAGLFWSFSRLTVDEMNRQREIAAVFQAALNRGAPKTVQFYSWFAAYLCIAIASVFLAGDALWYALGRTEAAKALDVKIPITVQVGAATPSIFQVPLEVSVSKKTGR